jgi:hypothetical protein
MSPRGRAALLALLVVGAILAVRAQSPDPQRLRDTAPGLAQPGEANTAVALLMLIAVPGLALLIYASLRFRPKAQRRAGLRESGRGGMAHACELETSLYLHIAPEAVDMSKATDEHGYPAGEHAYMDWSDGPLKLMPWWSSFSESGVQGDASKGTAEKGKVLFEAAVCEIIAFVVEMRSKPIPTRRDHHDD